MRIPRKALSIDFASKEIKIIEGKYTQDTIQILKAITIEVPPDCYSNGRILNKNLLAKVIKDKLEENKIKTIRSHAIISSSEILIREIIIPKVAHEEIKSVVNYQIADYLPIDVDDYVVQYLTQGNIFEEDMEKIKVLLLAIPKDMVLSHLELLQSIGLRPGVLDHQGNAMVKLLDFNNRVNENYSIQNLAMASVDMGYTNSKVIITKNGKVEVARTIDFGVKTLYSNMVSFFDYSIEELEEKLRNIESLNILHDEFSEKYSDDGSRFSNIVKSSVTEFCGKVNAIVQYYNTREVGNALDCILLQGGLSNIPEMDDVFFAYFNIPSMQLSTLDKIRFDGNLSKYASAIGGLIRMDVN